MVVIFGIILVFLYTITAYLFVYLRRGVQSKRGTYNLETVNDELEEPIKAPNPVLKNLNGETVNLFDGKPKNRILAFASEACIYCEGHIETLIHEIESSKSGPDNLMVIMNETYKSYGQELSFKYGHLLTVLFADQRTLEKFDFVKFLPAFTLINDKQYIIAITPVPKVAVNYWNQLKMGA